MNSLAHAWKLLPSKSKFAILMLSLGRNVSNFLDMLAVESHG